MLSEIDQEIVNQAAQLRRLELEGVLDKIEKIILTPIEQEAFVQFSKLNLESVGNKEQLFDVLSKQQAVKAFRNYWKNLLLTAEEIIQNLNHETEEIDE